jgi:hypothetical protein
VTPLAPLTLMVWRIWLCVRPASRFPTCPAVCGRYAGRGRSSHRHPFGPQGDLLVTGGCRSWPIVSRLGRAIWARAGAGEAPGTSACIPELRSPAVSMGQRSFNCALVPICAGSPSLAHLEGSVAERAYPRTDMFERRRNQAETWARFCAGEADEKGIEIRRFARPLGELTAPSVTTYRW